MTAQQPQALAGTDGGAWLNPDCWDGKHAACGGDAWDDDDDVGTPCQCPCHGDHEPGDGTVRVVDVPVSERFL